MLDLVLLDPIREILDYPPFFFEVLIGGLLTGVMYALVALGFVLIFKASGVFNFAQGAMVLFAALTFVGLKDMGLPLAFALLVTAGVMVLLAWSIERIVLRPLVGQAPISLFMATIGITFFLDGFGQTMWGSDVRALDVGIPNQPIIIGELFINSFDLIAGLVCGVLVAALALFFQYTSTGRALARRRRRPQRGDERRHPAQHDLDHRLVGRGHRRPGRRDHVGLEAGRAVHPQPDRPQGAAGADHRRLHLGARRHRRRAHHRRRREGVRGVLAAAASAAPPRTGSPT